MKRLATSTTLLRPGGCLLRPIRYIPKRYRPTNTGKVANEEEIRPSTDGHKVELTVRSEETNPHKLIELKSSHLTRCGRTNCDGTNQ